MSELVFVDNGKVVTDSLTVAEMFGKDHSNVLKDIRKQIEYAGAEFAEVNFYLGEYRDKNNQLRPKFNLTEEAFTLVVFGYNTKESVQSKIKFIQEFKKMREHLNKPRVLSEREQLIASIKLSLETSEELSLLKNDVQLIKHQVSEELTLNHGQQQTIHHQIKKRVESIKDDYDMSKNKLYAQIHSHLRRAFSAPKYMFIKRKDYDEAMAWVKSWRPLI